MEFKKITRPKSKTQTMIIRWDLLILKLQSHTIKSYILYLKNFKALGGTVQGQTPLTRAGLHTFFLNLWIFEHSILNI